MRALLKVIVPCLLLALLATACSPHLQATTSRRSLWPHNRTDRAGDRQGLWITYHDSANTRPQIRGRYRHSWPVGRFRHYAYAGYLERYERFRRRYIDITDYHPNGQVWYRGRARLVREPSGLHYYWYGDWVVYAPDGKMAKIETYDHGQRVASWSPTKGNLVP